MSIEIVFYPAAATKDALRKHLLSQGFEKCGHLREWPAGSLHFKWFESKNYESVDGVEATVYMPGDDERSEFGGGEWALHTRTRVSASSFDREKQNEVVRSARQRFDGNFYNDHYGTNRYTKVQQDERSPAGRGIWSVYNIVHDRLESVIDVLPQPVINVEGDHKLLQIVRQHDPSRVLYNALVPFAVAALEHFFGQTFVILLSYDPRAQEKLKANKQKIELSDVVAISSGQTTIENVVAGWYSFQNIGSIHKAFHEWLGIDFWTLLRQRRKIGGRIRFLEDRLSAPFLKSARLPAGAVQEV